MPDLIALVATLDPDSRDTKAVTQALREAGLRPVVIDSALSYTQAERLVESCALFVHMDVMDTMRPFGLLWGFAWGLSKLVLGYVKSDAYEYVSRAVPCTTAVVVGATEFKECLSTLSSLLDESRLPADVVEVLAEVEAVFKLLPWRAHADGDNASVSGS